MYVYREKYEETINMFISFCEDGLWGLMDFNDNVVLPCEYEKLIHDFDDGADFYFFKKNNKWGMLDENLKVILPCEYDECHRFSEGLVGVMKDHEWGYINKNGEIVIPFNYSIAKNFENGYAFVGNEFERYGVIDKKGNVVLPVEYEDFGFFNCGLINVKKDSKEGFFDHDFKEVIPLIYDRVNPFYNGIAHVVHSGRLICIDRSQNEYTMEDSKTYQIVYELYEGKKREIIDKIKNIIINIGDNIPVKVEEGYIALAKLEIKDLMRERDAELAKIPKIEESENS